jgi:tellurite resistance protein
MDFFPEVMLTDREGELIALGLLAVARSDGKLHDRELALVQSFYGEVVDDAALRNLEAEGDIDPEVLAAGLTREPIPMLFLKSAVLCAYADGEYHDKEKAKIEAFAKALEVEDGALEELHQSVKEYLLSQLSHLKNTDAALEVAKELGI